MGKKALPSFIAKYTYPYRQWLKMAPTRISGHLWCDDVDVAHSGRDRGNSLDFGG